MGDIEAPSPLTPSLSSSLSYPLPHPPIPLQSLLKHPLSTPITPSEPDWVGDIEARNNFVIEKYVKGVEDGGDDIDMGVVKVG